MPKEVLTLYFAYGSNMASAQMTLRCPQSIRQGQARLSGYRWIIAADGYANVIVSPDDCVEGVLFGLSSADEAALDAHEEIAAGAYRKVNLPVSHAGTLVQALVYINTSIGEGRCDVAYSARLRCGFVDAGLGESYLRRYVLPFLDSTLF